MVIYCNIESIEVGNQLIDGVEQSPTVDRQSVWILDEPVGQRAGASVKKDKKMVKMSCIEQLRNVSSQVKDTWSWSPFLESAWKRTCQPSYLNWGAGRFHLFIFNFSALFFVIRTWIEGASRGHRIVEVSSAHHRRLLSYWTKIYSGSRDFRFKCVGGFF